MTLRRYGTSHGVGPPSIVLSGLEGTYAVASTAPALFTALLRRDLPARLLLLCLLLRSSWLTVEGGGHAGAAGVLHRRGGRAVVGASVGVAGGVPDQQSRRVS